MLAILGDDVSRSICARVGDGYPLRVLWLQSSLLRSAVAFPELFRWAVYCVLYRMHNLGCVVFSNFRIGKTFQCSNTCSIPDDLLQMDFNLPFLDNFFQLVRSDARPVVA